MIQTPNFDSIKQVNPYGTEYWSARDLMPLLGYGKKWQNFEEVIKRAIDACITSRQDSSTHFVLVKRKCIGGKGAIQMTNDYHLSWYAIHLILSFADIRKIETAQALTYLTLLSLDKHSTTAQCNDVGPLYITQERKTLDEIMCAFSHLKMVQQYKVTPYRIDLYFPMQNIAVECDERCHQRYNRNREIERQRYIEGKLGCTFVRYNPDTSGFHIGNIINSIMRLIYEGRMQETDAISYLWSSID